MTTNDTAANWVRTARAFGVAAATLAAIGLAGCETGGNLLGGGSGTPPSAAIAPPPMAQAPQPQTAVKLAIAPVIGPPESVSKALVAQVTGAAERQRVAIAGAGDQAAFTLRGFFVAPTKDKSANKLSYIWDVTDPANKRVNRITGEETLAVQAGNDPWTAVTPQVMQSIADKTAASLAAWLPTQTPGAAPVANAAPAVAQAPVATSNTTTGSIPGAIMAVSPRVVGAPGDGNTSLAAAMRKDLEEKGFQFSEGNQGAYRVVADVKIKPPKDGTQAIAINWTINDPKGQEVAKITQNNDVPAGYLDKNWGQSADDAAKAASVQIRQVIADHRSGKQIQSSGLPAGSKVN